MFYFVPAWYSPFRTWGDNTPIWFRVFAHMSFDDTVNQVKMFRNAEEDLALLILNYQPQLRYFLHNQDLLSVEYYSFFDDIQNVSSKEVKPLHFRDLDWPRGTRFIFSPFIIVARKQNKDLAHINLAENGNLLDIVFFDDGKPYRRYVFDDRGFVSSIIRFDSQGQEDSQRFLNERGVWQIELDLSPEQTGVRINPSSDKKFAKAHYATLEELITERLAVIEQKMDDDDVVIIASEYRHNKLLGQNFQRKRLVYSFFRDRYDISNQDNFREDFKHATLLVSDAKSTYLNVDQTLLETDNKTPHISLPIFDTRLRLGHSQTMKTLYTYFFIDTISHKLLMKYIEAILKVMEQNEQIYLRLISYQPDRNLEELKKEIYHLIESKYEVEKFIELETIIPGENSIDEQLEEAMPRITAFTMRNETEIIKNLDTVRLILDFGEEPDLFTQIAGISAGIPQINTVESDFVDHNRNGKVITNINQLEKELHYYFDGLANWNQSLVYSVRKMADYTSGRLLDKWKKFLEVASRV